MKKPAISAATIIANSNPYIPTSMQLGGQIRYH